MRTTRPSGFGRWKHPRNSANLVAAIEGLRGDVRFVLKGPKYRDDLAPEALKLHLGIAPSNLDMSVWSRVPDNIKGYISDRIRESEENVQGRWAKTSNEEALTGALLSGIDVVHEEGGWVVKIDSIEFSKQTKEPGTGADLAVVLDVVDDQGRRAFKSLWHQAKSAFRLPADPLSLPRLRGQIEDMRSYTDEAYALVITPLGVFAIKPDAPTSDPTPLHQLLQEAMACRAGDPAAKLLADSLNRQRVLAVLFEEAATWAPAASRRRLTRR